MRAQKLLNAVREQGMLAPANTKSSDGGVTPAQRSAMHQGVGDNLKEAIIDIHTAGQVRASSWVDHMGAGQVVGDGSIEPELAFANFEPSRTGPSRHDPLALAQQTAEMLAGSSGAALMRLP